MAGIFSRRAQRTGGSFTLAAAHGLPVQATSGPLWEDAGSLAAHRGPFGFCIFSLLAPEAHGDRALAHLECSGTDEG